MARTNLSITKLPNNLKTPQLKSEVTNTPLPTAVTQLPSPFNTLGKRLREREAYQKQLLEQQLTAKEASYKQLGGIKDPNDPLSLNSFKDVMNSAALGKRYGDWARTWWGQGFARIAAVFDVSLAQPLANLFTGDFKALGINMLTNFSETMDTLATPVKSLIAPLVASKEAKEKDPDKYNMPWYKRLISGTPGMGFTIDGLADMFGQRDKVASLTDAGEYNWDYDTGFWLSDMALEIVSDPINLIELGTGAVKLGTKAISEVADAFGKGIKTAVGKEALKYSKELSKQTYKKVGKRLIKETLSLSKQATEISQTAKSVAHKLGNKGSDIFKTIGKLDNALADTKGLVSDEANKLVNELFEQLQVIVKNTTTSKKQIDTINKLLASMLDYNQKVSRSAGDLLRTMYADPTDITKLKLTRSEKTYLKGINAKYSEDIAKGGKTAIQAANAKRSEIFENIINSPYLVRKYKGIDFNIDFITAADNISLLDYIKSVNAFLQDSQSYKVFKAVDALAEGTDAVDRALLKTALLGNPVTAGLYFGLKSNPVKRFGKYCIGKSIRKLTTISDYIKSKTVVARAMDYDIYEKSIERNLKCINIFATEDLNAGPWKQHLAQSIYDDTWAWLQGYGEASNYHIQYDVETGEPFQKPINLLADDGDLVKSLRYCFPEEFNGLGFEESIAKFSDAFDSLYLKASNGRALEKWDLAAARKAYKANPSSNDALNVLWSALNSDPAKTISGGKFVRVFTGIDPASARKSAHSIFNNISKQLPKLITAERIATQAEFKTAFRSFYKPAKGLAKNVDTAAIALQKTTKALNNIELLEQQISLIKKFPEYNKIAVAKLQNRIDDIYTTVKSQVSLYLENLHTLAEKDTKAPLSKLYRAIKKAEINSPYFGHKDLMAREARKFIEFKNSQQEFTREMLTSPAFQELIDSLRPGQDLAKCLDAEILRLEQEVEKLEQQIQVHQTAKGTASEADKLAVYSDAYRTLYQQHKEAAKEFYNAEFRINVLSERIQKSRGSYLDQEELTKHLANLPNLKQIKESLFEQLGKQAKLESPWNQKRLAQERIYKLKSIRKSVDSVDAYIGQLEILEKSDLPEGIKQAYLDTLHSYAQRNAKSFSNHFNANYYDFKQHMNTSLYAKNMKNRMTLEYYAAELSRNPQYKAKAYKYFKGQHTALEDAEFCQTLFEAKVLPELSKTHEVLQTKRVKHIEKRGFKKPKVTYTSEQVPVETYVHPEFLRLKNRQFIYFDFETTGLNASIDQIYEIGLSAPGHKSWRAAHSEFSTANCSPAVQRQLANRKTPLNGAFDEVDALIAFVEECKTIQKASGKELCFIGYNSQGYDIPFIKRRFAIALSEATENKSPLLNELNEAARWFENNIDSANLDVLATLKRMEGIPTVGEYSQQVKDLLHSYVIRQARNDADLVFSLPEDFIDTLKSLPNLDLNDYNATLDSVWNLFQSMKNSSRRYTPNITNVSEDNVRAIVDADYWKATKGDLTDDFAVEEYLASSKIQIEDPSTLLYCNNGRWTYMSHELPADITTSNEAVKWLKEQGIPYAPKWIALNATQQISTFPIIRDGEITLETLEGLQPIAFKNVVDADIVAQFFKYDELDIETISELTILSQDMSKVFNRIRNPQFINSREEIYSKIYSEIYSKLLSLDLQKQGIWQYLRSDLNLYQKFAVIQSLYNSEDITLSSLAHNIINDYAKVYKEAYKDADELAKTLAAYYSNFTQNSPAFRDSDLTRLYTYHTDPLETSNFLSRNEFLERIYESEELTGAHYARDLKEAFEYDKECIYTYTKDLEQRLDKHNVYSSTAEKLAASGQAQVKIDNVYQEIIDELKDGPEFDTFMSCDKQLNNNFEDKVLEQILDISSDTDTLTSFVYHQGKGIVIIPAGRYLTHRGPTTYNIKPKLIEFIEKYHNYEDKFIKAVKKDDDLIIYAKDYALNMRSGLIKPITLKELDVKRIVYDTFQLDTPNTHNRVGNFAATHDEQLRKLGFAYQEQYNKMLRLSTDYTEQFGLFTGGYGRTIDVGSFEDILKALPDEVRLNVVGDALVEQFFNTYGNIFNFSTLGRAAYRKAWEPFASSTMQSVQGQTYKQMTRNLSSVSQYAQFYYGDSPWLISSLFNSKEHNLNEIYSAIRLSDDFTVSYMGFDKNGLPKVIEIPINSVDDVQLALKNGAILLPNQTHAALMETINSARWSNSKFKVFHKINYALKVSMLLLNPGFIFRNFIDSTLKNFAVNKDAAGMMSSYIDAMDYYRRYNDTIQMLFGLDPDHPFRPDTLRMLFDNNVPPMNEELFILIHNFIENGPSAGSVGKVSDFYLKEQAPSMVQKTYEALMLPTKGLEQIERLAEYVQLIKTGMTNTAAYNVVTRTHFDYASKTGVARLVELIIPFYSFQVKNFEFWLDMLDKNPVLMANLANFLTPVWNFDDIDFERIQYYESRLNQITQANLILNEKGLTLKLNPSFMDPLSLLANPIDSLSGRVSPLFKPILNLIKQNDPRGYELQFAQVLGAATNPIPGINVAGAALSISSQVTQRYQSGTRSNQRTGSRMPLIAPSIFGSTKTSAQYGRASYTNSRAFSDVAMRRPRRINIYNKLYTDTGKNRWKLRMMPLDATTIKYRIRDNQNRFK